MGDADTYLYIPMPISAFSAVSGGKSYDNYDITVVDPDLSHVCYQVLLQI